MSQFNKYPDFKFTPAILLHRRQILGYTMQQIGDIFGVTKTTIMRWERGEKTPPQWHIERIAEFIAMKPEDILINDLNERIRKIPCPS